MTTTQTPEQMLREFHATKAIHAGLMPEHPTTNIPDWVRDLRMALLDEEVQELREAVAEGDIVKIADALGDIEHVTRGTAVAYGIPSDAVFAEIFRSNMTKDNSPAEGKLVKGPGYEAPDIAGVLGQGTEDRRHVPADVNGRDRLAASMRGDSPQSCYFWDIRKGVCHFEMLVLDCTPCAACPARPVQIGDTDDDE